jgi:hypothetical protein
MELDLFGNILKQKALTSSQRMTTRQVVKTGRDLYTTEPHDIERFIKAIQRDGVNFLSPIWEPAAGIGDISKMLIKYGYEVISTDIFPYNDQEIDIKEMDFFACTSPMGECRTIFTNPPFNLQEAFLEHALSMCVNVVFFVRLSFLSSIRRLKIYEKYNPAYKNGDISKGQNMVDYCVIMWKPPYKNETVLKWIA